MKTLLIRGVLGWANRRTESQLEAYGPGGRWRRNEFIKPSDPSGDLLGDALARAGAHEGAQLIIVAIERQPNAVAIAAELEQKMNELVSDWVRSAIVVTTDPVTEEERGRSK